MVLNGLDGVVLASFGERLTYCVSVLPWTFLVEH